jgi:predicted permease
VLLISSAALSSVNSALLCLQFDNHPNYVAKTVFYSTLLSAITMTVVIFLAQGGFLKQLALN